jgi:hypothetical protein
MGVTSAQAETGSPLNVVALGDSFGSGTGAGDYLDGTGVENGCWRSANSYSETVVARARANGRQVTFTNVTCSGATTADLQQPFKGEQPQVEALRPDTNVVFLSIGTNDIDFAAYGQHCLAADCSGPVSDAQIAKLPGMSTNILSLLIEIEQRSPGARVVMTGYGSQLTAGDNAPGIEHDPICAPNFFSSQERIDGNRVAGALDQTLRRTAWRAGATFVSPYTDEGILHPVFIGHSLCEVGAPYYRGLDALAPGQEGQEAVLHLNRTGQSTLADLVQFRLRW